MSDVRLIHGDCFEILPNLADEPIAWVITDPPYGISYVRGSGGRAYKGRDRNCRKSSRNGTEPIEGDNRGFDPTPFLKWPCLFFGADHFASRLPEGGSWHVWDKRAYSTIEDTFADL